MKREQNIDYFTCIFKSILEGKSSNQQVDWDNFKSLCLTFTVLDALGERVALLDRDFTIILCNQAYTKFYSSNGETIIGNKCYLIERGKDKPCFEDGEECSVQEVLQTGKSCFRFVNTTNKEQEQFISEIRCYPIKDTRGEVILVLFAEKDISEEYRMEVELKQKVNELQEFYDMAISREIKMIELKKEIETLKNQLENMRK